MKQAISKSRLWQKVKQKIGSLTHKILAKYVIRIRTLYGIHKGLEPFYQRSFAKAL